MCIVWYPFLFSRRREIKAAEGFVVERFCSFSSRVDSMVQEMESFVLSEKGGGEDMLVDIFEIIRYLRRCLFIFFREKI